MQPDHLNPANIPLTATKWWEVEHLNRALSPVCLHHPSTAKSLTPFQAERMTLTQAQRLR